MYLEFTAGLQAGRKRWVDLLHTSVCKVDPSEELTLSKPIANPKPTQGRHSFKNQIQTKTGPGVSFWGLVGFIVVSCQYCSTLRFQHFCISSYSSLIILSSTSLDRASQLKIKPQNLKLYKTQKNLLKKLNFIVWNSQTYETPIRIICKFNNHNYYLTYDTAQVSTEWQAFSLEVNHQYPPTTMNIVIINIPWAFPHLFYCSKVYWLTVYVPWGFIIWRCYIEWYKF